VCSNFLLLPLFPDFRSFIGFALMMIPELYIGFKTGKTSHIGFNFLYMPQLKELASNLYLFGFPFNQLYMFGIYFSFK